MAKDEKFVGTHKFEPKTAPAKAEPKKAAPKKVAKETDEEKAAREFLEHEAEVRKNWDEWLASR